ncbi:MAG: glycoside hydrolase family 88 protein [Acidobacteriaceae bacterium]|jgi:unsaturated rhamnogalacturonyl hydrolase
MRLTKRIAAIFILCFTPCALAQLATPKPDAPATPLPTPAQQMAATVLLQRPATTPASCTWGYEDGVRLDGMAAIWHNTADPALFNYIKAAVDPCIAADGSIVGYKPETHTLDNIEMGRAVLFLYRVTQDAKYARAAKFVHDQLDLQPRTPSGGYWHKQIYPNQMWLDGAYMAEPFRAEYAATFQQPADFDDIAHQLLLMDQHMRDPDSGLLKHGWDESKQMPWADKTTGLSPEVWGRAMGWYSMALVDTLDWYPINHPQRAALIAALNRTMAAVVKAQDAKTGLWWQVMTHDSEPGNYFEASASCMLPYALAKGVRLGLLPQADEENAKRAWAGIQKQFIVTGPDGTLILQSTVKVGGLGGTPYRAGDFDYYIHEPVVDQDKKGVGAFLLAGSEMEQSSTEALGQGKIALMDAWFNSQTRTNALGQTELYHYKWEDDSASGYSLFGRAFQSYGVSLATLAAAPTAAALAKAQIYIIASPDIPIKNPTPHYMDQPSGDAIEAWVKSGGVLLLFYNDRDNTEFDHFNTLSDRFGIHFNPVLSHHVVGDDHPSGEVVIPPNTGIFGAGFTAYMKDTCSITVHNPAKAVVTDHGDIMIAISHVGKGVVLAVVDPWVYNEYADGLKMRQYDGFEAAQDLAAWATRQAK